MRHFDIKNTVENVDFVNVMSYDLHGVWDGDNLIGKQVLAHTNLTEIKLALDLFWRNSVPADKLNLGLGFYGRSFQLADPSCHTPGCRFKGGATKGACSGASGILSYKEIMEIIESRDLNPYYDKENAVKYITWDQDQWVSYDDKDTYQQKIKFAEEQGLGGLLIWAIDQDTTKLDALAAVLYPEELKARNRLAEDSDYWKDSTAEDCYVTDCGGQCKAGFLEVEHQPCGGAKPVTRHSKKADSRLCCPVTSVPDSSKCTWRGEAPSCNGHCQDNEVAIQLNRWGDGKYCEDGNKAYCCEVPDAKSNTCYWTDLGTSCNKGDILKTWKGTFLQDLAPVVDWFGLVGHALAEELEGLNIDLLSGYCCPKEMDPTGSSWVATIWTKNTKENTQSEWFAKTKIILFRIVMTSILVTACLEQFWKCPMVVVLAGTPLPNHLTNPRTNHYLTTLTREVFLEQCMISSSTTTFAGSLEIWEILRCVLITRMNTTTGTRSSRRLLQITSESVISSNTVTRGGSKSHGATTSICLA